MEIITNAEFQKKFNQTIQNELNRNLKIENEIKAIDKFVYEIPVSQNVFKKQATSESQNKLPRVFDLGKTYIDRNIFHLAFENYLNNKEMTIVERSSNDNEESHFLKQRSANQSVELFKYYSWLKLLPAKKTKLAFTLNHQEKMLALHYLGMNTANLDNTKTAKILSVILGLSEQNTRENLGSLYVNTIKNPVRTKGHLENLKQHFESIGLNEIASKIEDDIKHLK